MNAFSIIILYFVIINIIGFGIMGLDKWKAKKGYWRVPESSLFIISLIGGSLGSILSMYSFRHKTRHWYFVFGLPAILVIELLIVFLLTKAPIQFIFM